MKLQIKNVLCGFSLLALMFVYSPFALAELTASVDVRELTTDETVNFTLSTTTGSGDPDFSVLQNDFEVLGQSTFSQTQSHNGRVIQNLSWRLQLLPKREGQLTIPAMNVAGESSEPIVLTVTSPRVVTGDDFGDFHVTVSVDNESPYVQSQVIYTIRVYHARNFLDGSLTSPNVSGVTLEQLGDDRTYRENRNGRAYRVLERKFALFAQSSGEITLPAVVLNANVAADGGSQGFFAPRKPVRRRSEELSLDVLPRPSDANANWWLPARQIQLDAQWDKGVQEYFVGESFTRTVSLLADGVDSTQLPEITPPHSTVYRVYADKPDLQKQATRDGLRSRRTEKWAIVPQQAGELFLPAIEVPWFNTRTGQAEVAVLPATTIQVQPARNAVTGEIKQSVQDSEQVASGSDTEGDGENAASLLANSRPPELRDTDLDRGVHDSGTDIVATHFWKWLAMIAMVGWALTIVSIFWSRRKVAVNKVTSVAKTTARELLDELDLAVKKQDPRSFGTALVDWAGSYWPDSPPGSLVALAERVESNELASDIRALDASLYSARSDLAEKPINLAGIKEQIRRLCDTRRRGKPRQTPAAPQIDTLPKL
ncbi:MAG: BatD family protein [Granulosicoccus sp.]|nr:BatD family protein [Granulosicoccus sp.]